MATNARHRLLIIAHDISAWRLCANDDLLAGGCYPLHAVRPSTSPWPRVSRCCSCRDFDTKTSVETIDVISVFTFFIQVTFFYVLNVFNFFPMFFFILKKTLSNAEYKYVKIQRKIFLEDDLAMILLILVCYVAYTAKYLTYLLKSTEVIHSWEFDNLHMTRCAKIIVGFMANVGNVFLSNVYKRFFIFCTFFYVF